MTNQILISVIVPVFNTSKYLKKCINSLLNQTYDNLEIILIEDASTDNSKNILEEISLNNSKINVIYLSQNVGAAQTRNIGISVASGHYITFVDSDDWLEPDYIENYVNEIIKNQVDIVCGGITYVDENDSIIGQSKLTYEENLPLEKALNYLFSDYKILAYLHTKFFKVELFKSIKIAENRIFEDTASTHLFFHQSKSISIISNTGYNYLKRQNSLTNTQSVQQEFIKKSYFYDALHSRVTFCLKNYPKNESLIFETCNRAIFEGFSLLYFMHYHKIFQSDLIERICLNLQNYPSKKSNMISKKTIYLYKLLQFNKALFLIFLRLFF